MKENMLVFEYVIPEHTDIAYNELKLHCRLATLDDILAKALCYGLYFMLTYFFFLAKCCGF
jgi:hypothetical protein